MKRLTGLLLSLCLLISLLPIGVFAADESTVWNWDGYIAISNASQLRAVQNDLEGKYYLTQNIVLSGSWTPIGSVDEPFTGIFDGNGYSISGVSLSGDITASGQAVGLFAANSGIIRNLTVEKSTLDYTVRLKSPADLQTVYIGMIAGLNNSDGIVSNCTFSYGSSFTANIYSNASIGGLVGESYGEISFCSNRTLIVANSDNCTDDYSSNSLCVGGIVGNSASYSTINYCENTGGVECAGISQEGGAAVKAGGIAGYAYSILGCRSHMGVNCTVENAHANSYAEVGGIAGAVYSATLCENTGLIHSAAGNSDVGGIAGYLWGTLDQCHNESAIFVDSYALDDYGASFANIGGLVGYSTGTITNSYNSEGGALRARFGSVYFRQLYGGFIAGNASNGSIANCYNYASDRSFTVSNDTTWCSASIAGYAYNLTIDDCYYNIAQVSYPAVYFNQGLNSISATGLSGKTAFSTKSNFSGFDFNTVWMMDPANDGFPVFRQTLPHEHSLSRVESSVGTCVTAGKLLHWKCSKCGSFFRDAGSNMIAEAEISQYGSHDYAYYRTVVSTSCTEDGRYIYKCRFCNDETEEIRAAWGHSFTEYAANGDATCLDDGTKTAVCDFCDATSTVADDGSALGHTEVTDPAVTVTCTADGRTEGSHCAVCGEVLIAQEILPAAGHIWDNSTVPPVCSVCGAIASGTCGNDLTWVLNSDGVLTISGTGAMWNYSSFSSNLAPWRTYSERIAAVILTEGVTSIGNAAFYDCENMTSIVIPEGVTSIGSYAFSDCDKLTVIDLPSTVSDIDSSFAAYADSLTAINASADNPAFRSVDGVLFTKDGKRLVRYPAGRAGTYTVPDGVTAIASSAFSGAGKLTSITFPDDITAVGSFAFSNCNSLSSVSLPDTVTTIGYHAFSGCDDLTSFRIPTGVTAIQSDTFNSCLRLAEITIHAGVHSIDDSAFLLCLSLETIDLAEDNPYYELVDGVLFTEDLTTLVLYPAARPGTSYTVPDGVTTVGYMAFNCADSLTSITLPDSVTVIEAFAFSSCSSLTSLVIPEGVTSIEFCAFSGCYDLTSITIPATVTYIEDNAFDNCNRLNQVTYGGSREQWEALTAELNNTALADAELRCLTACETHSWTPATCTQPKTCAICSTTEGDPLDHVPVTDAEIKGSCTADGLTEGSHCSVCKEVLIAQETIPAPGHTTGDAVTENQSNATCTQDGSYDTVFYCTVCREELSRETTTVSAAGHSWGAVGADFSHACQTCGSIETVESVSGTCGESLSWSLDTASGKLTITGSGAMTDYSAADPAPWGTWNASIKSLSLSTALNHVGSSAFCDCTALQTVALPSSVATLGEGAFAGCTALTTAVFRGSSSALPADLFSGCTALTAVTLPSTLTSVGENAFSSCAGLRTVTFGGTSAAWNALHVASGNEALKRAAILCQAENRCIGICGENLTWSLDRTSGLLTISGQGEMTCYSEANPAPWSSQIAKITALKVEEGVRSIGEYAFHGCSALKVVHLPAGITTVESFAFYGCTGLQTVHSGDSEPAWKMVNVQEGNEVLLIADIVYASYLNVEWNADFTTLSLSGRIDGSTYVIAGFYSTDGKQVYTACYTADQVASGVSIVEIGVALTRCTARIMVLDQTCAPIGAPYEPVID